MLSTWLSWLSSTGTAASAVVTAARVQVSTTPLSGASVAISRSTDRVASSMVAGVVVAALVRVLLMRPPARPLNQPGRH